MKINKIVNLFVDAFSWFRYVGWIYLAALIALSPIVYGAYALAVATPFTKLAITIGGIIIIDLVIYFYKSVPSLNYIVLVVMPVTFYSLILSIFALPWLISLAIIISILSTGILIITAKKEIKTPRFLVWIRNTINILTFTYLIYYLYTLL